MFIRFDIAEIHHASGQPLGVLHAVRYLRDEGILTPAERSVSDPVFQWMYDHLDAPDETILVAHPEAVSWFRATATECLRQAELLITILEAHGQIVTRRHEVDPGPLVYEDSVQVLALSRLT